MIYGSGLESTWLLMNILQLISFLPLIGMYISPNFRHFSLNLVPLHGLVTFIPNLFKSPAKILKLTPFSDYFMLMGFETKYLMLNTGTNFEMWAVLVALSVISWAFYKIFERK